MSLTLICEFCGEVFGPSEAEDISIFGPRHGQYTCPNCDHVVVSVAPPTDKMNDDETDSDDTDSSDNTDGPDGPSSPDQEK